MTDSSTEIIDLQEDQDIEDYLNIALANGFSKGTANVSARDMVKLRGLLKHYAKKKHPFTSCFNDQIKHGLAKDHAAKRCAVLKDLIKGTTRWRSTERKKNLSDEEKAEFILDDYPEDDNYILEFIDWAINLYDETVNIILTVNNNDEVESVSEVELAEGDVAWLPGGSYNDLRRQIEVGLNDGNMEYGSSYWVEDIKQSEALVCHAGKHYYVVPFSVTKKGSVELDDEDSWKPVERAWVESNMMSFSEDNQEFLAELYFTDAGGSTDSDGLVWKTFLREGKWAYSPENGKVAAKPLTIVKKGKSDPIKNMISMTDIKKNFDIGAIQHVTVPLNHEDKVQENTGFVKKLRFGKDEKGRVTLEAAIDFTEPDIKEKIDRGTIPNVSGGIHLNYINKESGKKFNSVLGHLALTAKPWLGGMAPFGVKASENLNVVGFSEGPESSDETLGGEEDIMTTTEVENADTFLSELGLSEDEVKARLARYEELEKENKESRVDQKVREWEDAKKAPAVITAAKAILMADDGTIALHLSEDEKDVSLTASDIVDRLVEASPLVTLADDPITDEATGGTAPPDDATEENLSDEVKSEARRLFLYENYSEADALAEAKRKLEETTA